MKQQNKNFLFNVAYQFAMHLFPLLTAAYISRVLGAEALGKHSFVNTISYVFGMFGLLGIANYGNREIAKTRDDIVKRSQIFSEIYSIQLMFSGISCIAYVLTGIFLATIDKSLYYIEIVYLFSIAFDISWLFYGMEQFKRTLVCNLLVKIISTIAVFVFVRTPKDIYIYAFIVAFTTLISQICLIIFARKIVTFHFADVLKLKNRIKDCFILFVPVIAFGLYRTVDKAMLGLMSSASNVSFYVNAERIVIIPIIVINALGTVMMPHMAYTFREKESHKKEYLDTIRFSMKMILTFASFASLGLLIWGTDISIALFGKGYSESGTLVLLLSPTILASGWASVLRTQYLIPNSLDAVYIKSTLIGFFINLLCNLIMIRSYGACGACVGTILAEYIIAFYESRCIYKSFEMRKYFGYLIFGIVKASICLSIVYFITKGISNVVIRITAAISISCVLFIITNWRFFLREFVGMRTQR